MFEFYYANHIKDLLYSGCLLLERSKMFKTYESDIYHQPVIINLNNE